jgi:hypothetical protein
MARAYSSANQRHVPGGTFTSLCQLLPRALCQQRIYSKSHSCGSSLGGESMITRKMLSWPATRFKMTQQRPHYTFTFTTPESVCQLRDFLEKLMEHSKEYQAAQHHFSFKEHKIVCRSRDTSSESSELLQKVPWSSNITPLSQHLRVFVNHETMPVTLVNSVTGLSLHKQES